MPALVLLWKPTAWEWQGLAETVASIRAGEAQEIDWSVGQTKRVPVGARAFLLRVGQDRPGVVATGWVVKAPQSRPHWDPKRRAAGARDNFVRISFDVLLDPALDPPFEWQSTASPRLRQTLRYLQGTGKSIPDWAATELEGLWSVHVGRDRSVGSAIETGEWLEGKVDWRYTKHRARERSLRRAKIEDAKRAGPLRCAVPGCGFDFEARYGELGRDFAHVHHLRPLAELEGEQSVSLDDLAIVCANCHAMVHRGGECRPLHNLIPPDLADA